MATRFYLEYGTTPAVTPSAWDSSWNYITSTFGPYSHTCTTTVQNTTLTDLTHVNDATGTAQLGATARFISAPLAAQTISGTIKGQILCYEASPSNSATIAIAITRINSAGTYQDTLLAASASDAGTTTPPEMVVGTATNRSFQDAAESASLSLTSRTFAAGDRLVIEIGVREVRTTSFEYLIVGTNASSGDLPEDTTTTTTTYRPWVEFSGNLTFSPLISASDSLTVTDAASQLVAQTLASASTSDSVTVTDLATQLLTTLYINASASESVTVSDVATELVTALISAWEEVTVSDISDVAASILETLLSTWDDVVVTDAATQAVGILASAFEHSGSDTLTSSNWD